MLSAVGAVAGAVCTSVAGPPSPPSVWGAVASLAAAVNWSDWPAPGTETTGASRACSAMPPAHARQFVPFPAVPFPEAGGKLPVTSLPAHSINSIAVVFIGEGLPGETYCTSDSVTPSPVAASSMIRLSLYTDWPCGVWARPGFLAAYTRPFWIPTNPVADVEGDIKEGLKVRTLRATALYVSSEARFTTAMPALPIMANEAKAKISRLMLI